MYEDNSSPKLNMVSKVLGDNSPNRKQPSSNVSRWLMILLIWLNKPLCSLTGISCLSASKCFFLKPAELLADTILWHQNETTPSLPDRKLWQ